MVKRETYKEKFFRWSEQEGLLVSKVYILLLSKEQICGEVKLKYPNEKRSQW